MSTRKKKNKEIKWKWSKKNLYNIISTHLDIIGLYYIREGKRNVHDIVKVRYDLSDKANNDDDDGEVSE